MLLSTFFAFTSDRRNQADRRNSPRAGNDRRRSAVMPSTAEFLEARTVLSAITIQFDYRFDTSNFFDTQAKRDALQLAGNIVASHLDDSLTAITPGSGNTWDAEFTNPATGAYQAVTDLSVPSNTLIVFVGGRDLPTGGELGYAEAGGWYAYGTQSWIDTVAARGQA